MIYEINDTRIEPLMSDEFFGTRVDQYAKWWEDPVVTQFTSHGCFPKSKKKLQEYIEHANDNENQIVWGIIDTTGQSVELPDEWIGNVSLQQIDWCNRSAEVAIIIGERTAWGKGHCTRVLKMVLDHARQRLGLHRVWAGTMEDNKGFQKSTMKAGMEYEGMEKEAVWNDGRWKTIWRYSKVWDE